MVKALAHHHLAQHLHLEMHARYLPIRCSRTFRIQFLSSEDATVPSKLVALIGFCVQRQQKNLKGTYYWVLFTSTLPLRLLRHWLMCWLYFRSISYFGQSGQAIFQTNYQRLQLNQVIIKDSELELHSIRSVEPALEMFPTSQRRIQPS